MKFNKIFLAAIFLCMFTFGYSQNNTSIKPVLNAYLGLKEALVATNNEQAITSATTLVKALSAVNTADLNAASNKTWGKLSNDLINFFFQQYFFACLLLATVRTTHPLNQFYMHI